MERRRRRRRAVVALGITFALVAGVGYGTWQFIEQNEYLLDERCEVSLGDQTIEFSPEQARNAAVISAAAADLGLPPEAAVHGVAMSLQETDLTDRADRETEIEDEAEPVPRALFARGTPSWSDGPAAQVAETSVSGFYEVLNESWRAGQEAAEEADDEESADQGPQYWEPQLGLDAAAEVLERPHNPQFYPDHASRARAFAGPLAGQQPVGMTCYISQLQVPGPDPGGLVDEVVAAMPNALQIPFTEPDEDASEEAVEDFVPEPILDDAIETSGEGAAAQVRIQTPAAEGDYDYQWLLAQWAVATARDYGIQTVEAGPYIWQRETGRWERSGQEPTSSTAVSLGFAAD